MALKRQRIVLDMAFDDEFYQPPSNWDWNTLADMTSNNALKVVAATDAIRLPGEKAAEEGLTDYFDDKTPYFDQKDAPLLLGHVGVMQREPNSNSDYVLHGDSVWITTAQTPGGVVYIYSSAEQLCVEIHKLGKEFDKPVMGVSVPGTDLNDEENDNG